MDNKIELIHNAIDEIRNIVNAECVPISELPAAVEEYVLSGTGGGFTTAFIFSSVANPTLPTAESLDVTTGVVNELDEDWKQPGTVTTRARSVSSESNNRWMSYAIFNAEGRRTTNWSVPFNIKGEPGADGVQGEQGIPGISGEQGAPGENAKTYRTALAYTSTDTVKTPLTPYGGYWNKNSNSISDIKADDGFVWTTEPNLVEDKTYRWISEAIFEEDGFVGKSWSTPFRITGENGADGINGKDGESIIWKGEFLSREDAIIANGEFQNGWAYRDIDAKTSYIFQDGTWYIMSIDGTPGTNGIDGKPIVWKGDLETAPENPEINWCYRDINNGRVYIYCVVNNGDPGWALMVSDGDPGTDGKDGADGMNVYITYHDSPITEMPAKPEGDGTTNGWHTASNTDCIWMSQKIAKSVTEGDWGDPILLRGATGEQGPPGEPGKDGSGNGAPIVYPSGVITKDNYSKFTGDSNRASYGFYEGDKVNVDPGYFIAWGSPNGVPGDQSVAFWNILDEWEWNNLPEINDSNPGYWLKMQNYEAIYSNIGVFNQALVGRWVFAGNYMFSQEGELGYYTTNDTGLRYGLYFPTGTYNGLQPGDKCTYETMLDPNMSIWGEGGRWTSTVRQWRLEQKIANGMWIPNVLIDSVTGDAWFAKKSLIINSDESISLNLEGTNSTNNEPSHLKIDLDGIVYQNSENTNKVKFNIGQDGILFSKGDSASDGVEFTLNEEGLALNQYANGSRSTPIRATPWGCYIGNLSVDNNGLSYSAEDRGFTCGPYGFSMKVEGSAMNLMGQGESCISVNTMMTKLGSPYLIGIDVVSKYDTAIRTVGSFDGLCPKTEFVTGTSHTVDPYTYTVVCTGSSSTTITLPEEPDVHKQIEILKMHSNKLTIVPSGADKIRCLSQSSPDASASTTATGLLKVIYNADNGVWYTSFTDAG